jgi:hypothetical protein
MKLFPKLGSLIKILCILILTAKSAQAYFDPGVGSMLVQALIATIAAVSVSFGLFRRRIKIFFTRIFSRLSKRNDVNDN